MGSEATAMGKVPDDRGILDSEGGGAKGSARDFDVCVFGAGPAAISVALRLLDLGREVVVLDRTLKARPWGGESFSGAVRGPLTALGLWDDFATAGHVQGYERQAAWGGEPQCESSLVHTDGPMWHVDRERFDGDLRAALRRRAGAFRPYRRLRTLSRRRGTWQIVLDEGAEISARFLVDATGRSRALAKRLGARVAFHDRLMALTAEVPGGVSDVRVASLMIQSTPFGWWYAAPVPRGHVVALFTDSDLAAPETRRRLRPAAANSAFTHLPDDEGWLAVGDASASYDPLCGWGVYRALADGILAADAIDHRLRNGDGSCLSAYRRHCEMQFGEYLKGLTRHYSLERRWASAPFWKRRLGTAPMERGL